MRRPLDIGTPIVVGTLQSPVGEIPFGTAPIQYAKYDNKERAYAYGVICDIIALYFHESCLYENNGKIYLDVTKLKALKTPKWPLEGEIQWQDFLQQEILPL